MLESYIAPLFTGYVDKYICNLKPEDLSLSIWGGDVILNNLELNLDILQKELNLPIKFLSGKIYKLHLHVPWTRITYEPIVVTVDTMEFIVKLKAGNNESADKRGESSVTASDGDTAPAPSGYMQGILNKVMNNISFQINNIIIKYTEDDMVFSVNVKSVDFSSAEEMWEKAFIELTLPDLLLRKTCNITDLTICLDQRNSSGKIELYQDPVLFKCNLLCRIALKYRHLTSAKPYTNTMHIFCDSLDFSLIDQQVPMVLRLINLVIGLYYGTLDLPGCANKIHPAPRILKEQKKKKRSVQPIDLDALVDSSDGSWATWALSMVPGLSGDVSDESPYEMSMETVIAVYITNMTLTVKKTSQSSDTILANQRFEFTPIICLELSQLLLDFKILDETFFNCKLVVGSVIGFLLGQCCLCRKPYVFIEDELQTKDDMFLQLGRLALTSNPLMFLTGSLFSTFLDSNSSDIDESSPIEFVVDHYSEESDSLRAVSFDYRYEMVLPEADKNEMENIFLYPEKDEKVYEVSEKCLKIGPIKLYCSTRVAHIFDWFLKVASSPFPSRRYKSEVFLDCFVLEQLEIGNILSRKFEVSISGSECYFSVYGHNEVLPTTDVQEQESIYFKTKHVFLAKIDPMYPNEFYSLVKSNKLFHLNSRPNLNSQINLTLVGVEAGLCLIDHNETASWFCSMLQSECYQASLEQALLGENSESLSSFNWKCNFYFNETVLLASKHKLLVAYHVVNSWMNSIDNNVQQISDVVFSDNKSRDIEMTVTGCSFNFIDCASVQGFYGQVQKIALSVDEGSESCLIFEAPCSCDDIYKRQTWFTNNVSEQFSSEFIDFRIQYQKSNDSSPHDDVLEFVWLVVSPCVFYFNESVHQWLNEEIDSKQPKRHNSPNKQARKILNSSISTCKRTKSYARVIGSSTSTYSADKGNLDIGSPLTPDVEVKHEPFGEWLARKINTAISFHVHVDIKSFVLVIPDGYLQSVQCPVDILGMLKRSYLTKNGFSSTLLVCCPEVYIESTNATNDIFLAPIPVVSKMEKSKTTLPWSISGKNLAVIALMPSQKLSSVVENFYLCKPVSWDVYLASSLADSLKEVVPLESISEFSKSTTMKTIQKKTRIAFVLHVNSTVLEVFVAQEQIQFLLNILQQSFEVVSTMQQMFSQQIVISNHSSPEIKCNDINSLSSSIVDHAEVFSTFTDSAINAKQQNEVEVSVSLWIQWTLPKIKLVVLSSSPASELLYQVTSEINELMFSFDYQDDVLCLSSKVASFDVFYSLLRCDNECDAYAVMDQGSLFCQKEETQCTDSKTFLSICYKRTYHQHIQNILSPSNLKGFVLEMPETVLSCGSIVKQNLSIYILPFDVICNTKPILSSLRILTDVLSSELLQFTSLNARPVKTTSSAESTASLVILPEMTIHIDCIRLIFPSDRSKPTTYSCIDDTECIFLFCVQSINLTSAPCNPLSKTVIDKDIYKQVNQTYREPLKRLKVWNIQYELEVKNMGLSTMNWALFDEGFSMPQATTYSGQNPALEWNQHPEYVHKLATSIYSGFDLKVTLAPPILIQTKNEIKPITTLCVDIHSPNEIKVFVNLLQICLAKEIVQEFNSFGIELAEILSKKVSLKDGNKADEDRRTSDNETNQNLPVIELFASVCGFSVIMYWRESTRPLQTTVYPAALVSFTQLNCSLMSIHEFRLKFTVHSLSVLTCSHGDGVYDDGIDASDFNTELISCCSGWNTNQTGALADIFTLVLTVTKHNFLKLSLSVNKPLCLTLCYEYRKNIEHFIRKTLDLFNTVSGKKEIDVVDKQLGITSFFRDISINTRKVTLVLSLTTNSPEIVFQWQHMESTFHFLQTKDSLEAVDAVCDLANAEIFFINNKERCDFLAPFICNVKVSAEFLAHSGNEMSESYPPRLLCWFNFGPIKLCVCQKLHTTASEIMQEVTRIKGQNQTKEEENGEFFVGLTESEDDLRNGVAEYIFIPDDEEMHDPDVNEIIFKQTNSFGWMVWKYPQARVITDIDITPVPFPLDNHQCDTDREIDCQLEYWDELKQCFCVHHMLSVHESKTSSVRLCDHSFLLISNNTISHTWRVTIPYHSTTNNMENAIVTPSSLALCMKVNSVFSPTLVPSCQMRCSVSSFTLSFEDTVASLGQASPVALKPFFLEQRLYPETTEMLSVCLKDLILTSCIANTTACTLTATTDVEIQTMDFDDFCWIDFLPLTSFFLHVKKPLFSGKFIAAEKLQATVDVKCGKSEVMVTPTSIHTLSLLSNHWQRSKTKEAPVYSHMLIFNSTDNTLYFKQVNSDKDLSLCSGETCPYSWHLTSDRLLVFTLCDEVMERHWTEAVDVSYDSVHRRELDGHVLLVEVKTCGGLRKQIILHGSCSFTNKLNEDVMLQIISQQPNLVDEKILLPANVSRPSTTLYFTHVRHFKVGSPESNIDAEVFEVKESVCCIKIHRNNETTHAWLCLTPDSTLEGHMVLTISPLFVVCNHLPNSVTLRFSSQGGSVEELNADGKGCELQVTSLLANVQHQLSFCLAGSSVYSNPMLTLSTNLHQQLQENTCFAHLGLNHESWPYLYINESLKDCSPSSQRVFYETHSSSLTSSNQPIDSTVQQTELVVQLSLFWSHLPTILIDIKPCFLVHNASAIPIVVLFNEEQLVDSKETISIFHYSKKMRVGLFSDSTTVWSSEVGLLKEMEHSEKGFTPCPPSHCLLLHKRLCFQLTVACCQQQGMFVVEIRERFMVHNMSTQCLHVVPFMSGTFSEKQVVSNVITSHLSPSDKIPCGILNNNSPRDAVPEGLYMNFAVCDAPVGNCEKTFLSPNHVLKPSMTFCLSKEHLRESIVFTGANNDVHSFVMTSSLDSNTIHVFIKEDSSTAVVLHNKCSVGFFLKDIPTSDVCKKRYGVICTDEEDLVPLETNATLRYQPKAFQYAFPQTGNKVEFACQLALNGVSGVELSQPILLEKDCCIKAYVPSYQEILLHAFLLDSTLYVELNETKPDNMSLSKCLQLPVFNISVESMSILFIDNDSMLLNTTLDDVKIQHITTSDVSRFKLSVGYVQVDNPMTNFFYHFPVLFLPMRKLKERYHTVTQDAPFPEMEACLEVDFCTISFTCYTMDSKAVMDNVRVNIQPFEMYLEDTYFYKFLTDMQRFLPFAEASGEVEISDVHSSVLSILQPLHICNIEISELSVLLSVHASMKLFLSADHMPVVLGRFRCEPTQTVAKEFLRTLLYHYATQLLVQAGWMLGSLELLGNPTGLIHNVGQGLTNLLAFPYHGLKEGPSGFVSGVSHGASSFFTHLSTGTLTSINNFTSSISRNMDRLCYDETHVLLQEERRMRVSRRENSGIGNAFGGLGMSLLGAVAGIVDHPLQNLTSANSTSEAFSGVVSGFVKGMVGAITKPIGGTMEFISQTSQEILQGAGLVKAPEIMFCGPAVAKRSPSRTKFMWQFHFTSGDNLLLINDVLLLESQQKPVSIVLTGTALFVMENDATKILYAFPLNEIEMDRIQSSDCAFKIQIRKSTRQQPSRKLNSLDENPNFRQFFESFHTAPFSSQAEALCDSNEKWTVIDIWTNNEYGVMLLEHFSSNKGLMYEIDCTENNGVDL